MEAVCQACGYQRKPTDQVPDWECPSCGKVYAKTSEKSPELFLSHARSSVVEPRYRQKPQIGPITWAATVGSVLIMSSEVLTAGSNRYLGLVTVVAVVMPWIALAGAYILRGQLSREAGEGSFGAVCLSLLALTAGVGGLALFSSQVFDSERAWREGLLFAVPFGLVYAAVVRYLQSEIAQACSWLLWPLLIVAAYFYGGALFALGDRWLDHSSPVVNEAKVIATYEHSGKKGGGIFYVANVGSWGTVQKGAVVTVSRREYDTMVPGKSVVCMATHPGALGLAWGARVPCAEQSSTDR